MVKLRGMRSCLLTVSSTFLPDHLDNFTARI